jgi:hypothetical protein
MLPAELRRAIAEHEGGRVVLVLGAGCSKGAPTSLPLASELAEETYGRLIADEILVEGQCANYRDLSALADVIFERTGHQDVLVSRFNPQRFRNAEPNSGYKLAAALLRERAISSLMTLNFDLAISTALANVGAVDVSTINGPEDFGHLGLANAIYLHRNANAEPDRWILRSISLDAGWREGWEGIIAHRVLVAPVVVFVGLGSPAAVLIETTRRISRALQAQINVYQVDTMPRAESAFFRELGIPDDAYIQNSWEGFMEELAARVVHAHQSELEGRCERLIQEQGLTPENCHDLCNRMLTLGLLGLGLLRSRWILDRATYLPLARIELDWIADLVLCVGLVERITESMAYFSQEGVVEFRKDDRIIAAVIVASGKGISSWLSLEAKLQGWAPLFRGRNPSPRCALVAGVQGARAEGVSPPQSIVAHGDAFDIIPRASNISILGVTELRQDPSLARRVTYL